MPILALFEELNNSSKTCLAAPCNATLGNLAAVYQRIIKKLTNKPGLDNWVTPRIQHTTFLDDLYRTCERLWGKTLTEPNYPNIVAKVRDLLWVYIYRASDGSADDGKKRQAMVVGRFLVCYEPKLNKYRQKYKNIWPECKLDELETALKTGVIASISVQLTSTGNYQTWLPSKANLSRFISWQVPACLEDCHRNLLCLTDYQYRTHKLICKSSNELFVLPVDALLQNLAKTQTDCSFENEQEFIKFVLVLILVKQELGSVNQEIERLATEMAVPDGIVQHIMNYLLVPEIQLLTAIEIDEIITTLESLLVITLPNRDFTVSVLTVVVLSTELLVMLKDLMSVLQTRKLPLKQEAIKASILAHYLSYRVKIIPHHLRQKWQARHVLKELYELAVAEYRVCHEFYTELELPEYISKRVAQALNPASNTAVQVIDDDGVDEQQHPDPKQEDDLKDDFDKLDYESTDDNDTDFEDSGEELESTKENDLGDDFGEQNNEGIDDNDPDFEQDEDLTGDSTELDLQHLENIVMSLPEDEQTLFIDHYLKKHSLQIIAECVGQSPEIVIQRLELIAKKVWERYNQGRC